MLAWISEAIHANISAFVPSHHYDYVTIDY